jgi:hypothetical protein
MRTATTIALKLTEQNLVAQYGAGDSSRFYAAPFAPGEPISGYTHHKSVLLEQIVTLAVLLAANNSGR